MNGYTLAIVILQAGVILGVSCAPALAAGETSVRQTLSLDGTWEILFDPDNKGRDGRWHRDKTFSSLEGRRKITVPGCWEEIEKDYEGVAFYRRTFAVPAAWEGKVVRLHFDAVNFQAEVWLNDQAVGMHEGGFTPFAFRVEKIIRPGRANTLTLRVAGPILLKNKRIEGVGPLETPQWRGAITGGIWQSAKLIATGDVYVRDAFIQPKIADDTVTFDVELVHRGRTSRRVEAEITIGPASKPGKVVAKNCETFELKPGVTTRRCTLGVPKAVHWSPDNPHLYRAELSVNYDGAASDRFTARFGMREFTIRDKTFCLNGKPMYLKATFFEGLYPVKLAYPDSREMAAREIRLAKEAGFNMIRPWRKPPPPMWLDLADEMGVLTVGSLAIECMDFPVETARLPGWVENEVRQSILRDRSRTCVVQWELFNELKRPVLKQMLHPMAMLARRLDPTRLILDESGGWARGANIYLPHSAEPIRFNDIHNYPGQKISEEVYDKLLYSGRKTHAQMRAMGLRGGLPGRNVVPGLMTFFSELGYGSLPDLADNNARFAKVGNPIVPPTVYHRRLAEQHTRALKATGFDRVYPDLKRFCLDQQRLHGAANKRMIEAVRCNPAVKGYCIHALTAGDWIIGAGLLDLFRNPKTYAYEGTKAANQPRILSIRVRPRNVYAARGTRIEITGVNELSALDGQVKVTVCGADGVVAWSGATKVKLAAGISRLLNEKLDTKAMKGTYTVRARLTAADGSLIATNTHTFDVFTAEQLAAPKNRIAVLDSSNGLKWFLKTSGVAFEDFSARTDPALPVFVSRLHAKTPAQKKLFAHLAESIKAGRTAVYVYVGWPRAPWGRTGEASPLLPVNARTKRAFGHWICIPRLVKKHPIFDGLPADGMMGPVYQNVWAQNTLLDVGGELVAGSIGFDWFPDFDRKRRHYYGPGDVWWGADVAVVPHGKGRCILSQLHLIGNLGKDPVADRLLFNLIRYATAK